MWSLELMNLWTVRIFGVPLNLAWEELYTDGAPMSHQAYGLWIERRTSEPLFSDARG